MSILKTYMVAFTHADTREIDYHKRRARSLTQLHKDMIQEFGDPNDIPDYWYVVGRYRKELKRPFAHEQDPPFRSGSSRPGKYIYRHKGRRKRGRKNYPNRYWGRFTPVVFTFTESYSAPVRNFIEAWVEQVPAAPPFLRYG